MKKRVISVLLIALLVLSLIPSTAFAEQEGTEIQGQVPAGPEAAETVDPADTPAPSDGPESEEPPAPSDGSDLPELPAPSDGPESEEPPAPADGSESGEPLALVGTQALGIAPMAAATQADISPMGITDPTKWKVVTYDAAGNPSTQPGGTITSSKKKILLTEYYVLTAEAKPGYYFDGWSGTTPLGLKYSEDKGTIEILTFGYDLTATFREYSVLTVNVNGSGNVAVNPSKSGYKYNEDVKLKATADDGWRFTGWSDGATGETNPITIKMDGHKTVTANFEEGYKVTLNLGAGGTFNSNGSNSITLTGVPKGKMTVPDYTLDDGYRLVGWSGGSPDDIRGNTTLNAIYEVRVTFEGGAGVTITGNNPVWVSSGSKVTAPAYTVAEGYRFIGWDFDFSKNITRPTTITANAIRQYRITLGVIGSGGFAHRERVEKNWDVDSRVELDVSGPFSLGAVHTGWLNGNTGEKLPKDAIITVTEDCTYYAIFESYSSQYVYVYAINGKLGKNINGLYPAGTTINLEEEAQPMPISPYYKFKQWERKKFDWTTWKNVWEKVDPTVEVVDGLKDKLGWSNEFRAVFEQFEGYEVTFLDANGNRIGDVQIVERGKSATAPNPPAAPKGYKFIGWLAESASDPLSSEDVNKTPVTANITYQACYGPITYTVIYDPNGGEGTMDSTTHEYGKSFELSPNSFTREGHTFAGWALTKEGPAKYGDKATVENLSDEDGSEVKLFAQWNINKYTVTFKGIKPDGSDDVVQEVEYNKCATPPTPPNRGNGYHFLGWRLENGITLLTPEDIENIPVTASITYVPCYEYRFKVTANNQMRNGGIRVTYGGISVVLGRGQSHIFSEVEGEDTAWFQGEPDKGYRFLRWNSDANSGYVDDNGKRPVNIYSNTSFTPYAHFEAIQYPIEYELNGGMQNPANPTTYTVEDEVVLLPPTRTGYNFTGWSNGGRIEKGSTGEKKFSASWDPITYFVEYDNNGGDGTMAKSTHVYDTLSTLTPNSFTREGHTFGGWATTPEGPAIYDDKDEVLNLTVVDGATVTLYAQWNINKYTVRFVDYDGTVIDTQTVEWNKAATAPAAPTREGHTFTGWDKAFDKVTSDMTVTAQYAINTYTVRFVDYDGRVIDTQTVEWNKAAKAPTAPTREGHTFTGWDKAFDNVTADMTVTAQYAINTYTVQFFDYTGTVQIGETQIVNWGGAATPVTPPARTGFTFTGWTLTGDDDTVETSLDNVRENIRAVATYALNRFTVTFLNYDGSVLGTVRVPYGGTATAPEVPAREGYTFTGWDTAFDYVTANLTVTALFRINTYTVTFVNYDGTVLSTQTVEWNTAATAPEVPAREGYTFTGWDADFSAVTADMTVTAQFAPVETVENEPVPGTGDNSVATLEDEPVPQQGPAQFPWWWIVIGVGAALLLFLLIFFLVKRRKEEQQEA